MVEGRVLHLKGIDVVVLWMRALVSRVRKASRKISERAIARDPGRAEWGSVVWWWWWWWMGGEL